jgi:hypothetical protein
VYRLGEYSNEIVNEEPMSAVRSPSMHRLARIFGYAVSPDRQIGTALFKGTLPAEAGTAATARNLTWYANYEIANSIRIPALLRVRRCTVRKSFPVAIFALSY